MKPIHHQTGTVKDVHSPAGQPMFVPKNFAHLPDCPVCKYGTPQPAGKRIICIDCGAVVGIVEKPTTHDTPT